jgi:hypothetical protein
MHWVLYANITESYYETLLFILHKQMQHVDCQLLVWYYSELFIWFCYCSYLNSNDIVFQKLNFIMKWVSGATSCVTFWSAVAITDIFISVWYSWCKWQDQHECSVTQKLPELFLKSVLVNDQCDAQILFYVFISIYNSLHVSNTSCSSSGERNCINTATGNSHSENLWVI